MKPLLKSNGIPKPQEVQPIKSKKDIDRVKQYLLGKKNKRDYCLFIVGFNVGLRASDLLKLKIGDVLDSDGELEDAVRIVEQKTSKVRVFTLNKSAKDSIRLYLDSLKDYSLDDYLFKSQVGGSHITVNYAHYLVKSTLRELNIKGNYGSHTWRKTFAYQLYVGNVGKNPLILPTLQKVLNHSSQSITLRYIGVDQDVITDLYENLNL